jgi:hypothetical protein
VADLLESGDDLGGELALGHAQRIANRQLGFACDAVCLNRPYGCRGIAYSGYPRQ